MTEGCAKFSSRRYRINRFNAMVYRKLGRSSTHRKSLLRNLVTSLIEYESITTTHAKAKEAQTAAERLITIAKNQSPDLQAAKARAHGYVFKADVVLPKLFDELAPRYKDRTGGYTRVLRLENRLGDNAPQSILELVGGTRDMRQAITARVVARLQAQRQPLDAVTQRSVDTICGSSPEAQKTFEEQVAFMKEMFYSDSESIEHITPVREPKKTAPIRILPNPLTKA
jgi:large subunit ribosomal protein L17